MKRFFYPAAMALTMLWVFSSCTRDSDLTQSADFETIESLERPVANTHSGNTIVDIAVGNPNFSILVEAVVQAGLANALSAPGNLTVFAPTNDAFTDFLDAAGINNLSDVPVSTLRTILLTHVLNGEFFAANLSTGYFKTLATGPSSRPTDIFINTMNGVSINGSVGVVATDIDASNGVIHVIDAVIAPSTIIALGASNPGFSTLVAALTRPDLPT
ncbi:MAG TPA: fasciclin domain-containing protein, partial [Flavilitoribacter sp.]|nr:fasciclin domain-containing protein [Flavilitoribacter sp.]